jgi:hypothetical protein
MVFTLVIAATLIPGADAPKDKAEKTPSEIKGEWKISAATDGKGAITSGDGYKLTVGDKEAQWGGLPYIADKKGKGAVKVDASKKPPTIELKVGDNVYKGIYRIEETKDGKQETLDLLFSPAGGDFPKEFGKEKFGLPEGFKGVLMLGSRKKK